MADNQIYLVNGTNPPDSNEFECRQGAIRLFAADLGLVYNLEVLVGTPYDGVWVPVWFNNTQIQMSDGNNVLVWIIAGQYRIVTSDGSDPLPSARIYYIESDTTDHDARVLYVLQTPSPVVSGGGGGGTPSDSVTDVGVASSRAGDPGTATEYSRGDHTHSFEALPESVMIAGISAVMSGTTDPEFTIVNAFTTFSQITREEVYIQAEFDLTTTSTSITPPIRLPGSYTDSGLNMGLIDLSAIALDGHGLFQPVKGDVSAATATVLAVSGANWNVDPGGTILLNAVYALLP